VPESSFGDGTRTRTEKSGMLEVLVSVLLLVSAETPLRSARRELKAGRLEEVLFALDGKEFRTAAERAAAAGILAAAAERAAGEGTDSDLALHFAQQALRQDPQSVRALEVGARLSLAAQAYGPAEGYTDRWLALRSRDSRARLLRAEIAGQQGEWDLALKQLALVSRGALSAVERARHAALKETAQREQRGREAGNRRAKALEGSLLAAQERMAARAAGDETTRLAGLGASRRRAGSRVVLYGTSWCPACVQARAWFEEQKIPFDDKDIERDEDAREELEEKKRAAGITRDAVPVIDVNGELMVGLNTGRIRMLLR
jgi:glutaredoxin 3